jgi:hypothetical protein
MKKLFLLSLMMLTFGFANAQASTAVKNHVYVMCDEYEIPSIISGQAIYIVLYSSGTVHMLIGKDLSTAIDNKATKTGTWSAYGSTVWWTWSDGKRSENMYYDDYSGNLKSGALILKDLGSF